MAGKIKEVWPAVASTPPRKKERSLTFGYKFCCFFNGFARVEIRFEEMSIWRPDGLIQRLYKNIGW